MDEADASAHSIRRRLLVFLIPSLLFLVLCAGLLTYSVALSVAKANYDRSLLDPVLGLAKNVRTGADGPHLDMSIQTQQALLYDHVDTVVFQIRSPDARIIAGTQYLPPSPTLTSGEPRFFDGVYRGEPVRIAAMRTDSGFSVQVGETLHKRRWLIWEILAAELVPTLLIAVAAVTLAWTGVKHGIAPLVHVRDELLGRGPDDLRPLDQSNAPPEIALVIMAFNNLLDRIRDSG
ncbi:MAG TPA: sensor histidine kinase N-terminal domain-containing protein, partial [Casimicrobiaceae bacterium]